jgi:E3 ubiquitin-protein ligase HERC1
VKHKVSLEIALGDLLIFIRRVVQAPKLCAKMTPHEWVRLVQRIAGFATDTGLPVVANLRTRLLAIHLLDTVLPMLNGPAYDNIVNEVSLFHDQMLSHYSGLLFKEKLNLSAREI